MNCGMAEGGCCSDHGNDQWLRLRGLTPLTNSKQSLIACKASGGDNVIGCRSLINPRADLPFVALNIAPTRLDLIASLGDFSRRRIVWNVLQFEVEPMRRRISSNGDGSSATCGVILILRRSVGDNPNADDKR